MPAAAPFVDADDLEPLGCGVYVEPIVAPLHRFGRDAGARLGATWIG
jgi:hypothetical protein